MTTSISGKGRPPVAEPVTAPAAAPASRKRAYTASRAAASAAFYQREKLKREAENKLQSLEAEQAAQLETPHTFWKRSIDSADQDKIAALREREDTVSNHLLMMDNAMAGRDSEYISVDGVDDDVKADVAEFGFCGTEIAVLEYWKHPSTFKTLQRRGDATSTLAKYGIITTIPSIRLHEWETWRASTKANPQQPTPMYASPLKCAQCASVLPLTGHVDSLCLTCQIKARRVREFNKDRSHPDATIFDQWSRLQDQ
jgi:hypothetical protein